MTPDPFDLVLEHGILPPPGGPVKRRLAVRGLILKGGKLLMVHSQVNGDWKFPGGGLEAREQWADALTREVAEETGYRTRGSPRSAGRILERAAGRDHPGSWFEMESRYYWTDVDGDPGPQALEGYEADLGFVPRWITVGQALAENRAVAARGTRVPTWLERETAVLALLANPEGLTGIS